MSALLQSTELFWTVLGLVFLAFVVGVRLTYGVTVEAKRMKRVIEKYARDNDAVDRKQQEDIDYVLRRVDALMHGKRVKKITIKRRKKEKPGGNQTPVG